ncbi:MAG: hypothetical protein HY300_11905 [Verrucomicrobia bacterium]|nr:hypothetical protein [Verrucomicrobiota bacterium]
MVLVKTSGYAPAFIAGKYVEFSYLNPAVGDSRIYYELDFDGPNYVYVYRYYNGSTGSLVRYTYRKTGANTATVNIPGLGTLQLRYTSTYGGTIVGPGINTTFDQDDLASD